jgi:tRNA(adenine34) deaminase
LTKRETYMSLALELAREAAACGEVPVGAVVVDGAGRVIGRGRNRREESGDATAHAELEAIRQACAALGDWRLSGCTLFVTLEPCPMCTGAIINARIPTVVFGAREALSGSCGSVIDLFSERYGHRPAVYPGVLREECAALLRDFFRDKR